MARRASNQSSKRGVEPSPRGLLGGQKLEEVLLVCPVRGALGASALAKDGLTPTEEARRVDFLHFLIDDRNYPPEHIRLPSTNILPSSISAIATAT